MMETFPIDPRALETGRGRILFDPVTAISGGVGLLGAATSLFGANSQAKAAQQAALQQKAAADKAGQMVTQTATEHNADITSAADRASGGVSAAAGQAGAGVATATDRANALLDPYRASGGTANDVLDTGLAAGGQFNAQPTAAQIQMDPGFAARLQAADLSKLRIASINGGVNNGSAIMDLAHTNQVDASSEYDKAFQRFQQNRTNNFNFANTVAGRGMAAAGTEGSNLIDSGKYSGDKTFGAATYGGDKIYGAANATADNANRAAGEAGEYATQAGNAQAAGTVGAANAWNSGLSGAAKAVTSGVGAYNLLSNPAAKKPVGNPSGWVS